MNRRDFMQASLLGVPAAALGSLGSRFGPGPQSTRSQFEITTEEAFDASEISAYEGNHPAVYEYIDQHRDAHLEHVRRWLRQPSDSAHGTGIEEMATMVRNDFRRLGFKEAELVPTTGHPGVWGYYDAGAETTLAVYMMYDVVPAVDDKWRVAPFAGELVEMEELGTAIMARGAANQKGPERAFLNAVESIIAAEGNLPINLMIAAEGEEEIGSRSYAQVIDRYGERLREAVGVICPHNSQNAEGAATLSLGMKGWLYLELEATGSAQGGPTVDDIGGWFKSIVDSPAWRLVQALSTLTSPDGNTITVPGYSDSIQPPNAEQQRLINSPQLEGFFGPNGEFTQYTDLGVKRWIGGSRGKDTFTQFLFDTTLNIDGISSGYVGPGANCILPSRAVAKIDSMLVPNQRPETALKMIRQHLDDSGFEDIEIRTLASYPPSQTTVEAPLVQKAISVYNKYGITPAVWPRFGANAPFYQFTERLDLPLILVGLGHGGNLHAPNEYMLVDPKPSSASSPSAVVGLPGIEKCYADLLYALSAA